MPCDLFISGWHILDQHSGPFLNTGTDESLLWILNPGMTQTGIHGTEYCGASARARLGFIREFWMLVMAVVVVLMLERADAEATFNLSCKDVLGCSLLSLLNPNPLRSSSHRCRGSMLALGDPDVHSHRAPVLMRSRCISSAVSVPNPQKYTYISVARTYDLQVLMKSNIHPCTIVFSKCWCNICMTHWSLQKMLHNLKHCQCRIRRKIGQKLCTFHFCPPGLGIKFVFVRFDEIPTQEHVISDRSLLVYAVINISPMMQIWKYHLNSWALSHIANCMESRQFSVYEPGRLD